MKLERELNRPSVLELSDLAKNTHIFTEVVIGRKVEFREERELGPVQFPLWTFWLTDIDETQC